MKNLMIAQCRFPKIPHSKTMNGVNLKSDKCQLKGLIDGFFCLEGGDVFDNNQLRKSQRAMA